MLSLGIRALEKKIQEMEKDWVQYLRALWPENNA